MPTHKELPDVDWDQYRRRSRRTAVLQPGVSLRNGLLFLIVVMVGFVVTDLISHTVGPGAQTHTLAASLPGLAAGDAAGNAQAQTANPGAAAQPVRTLATAPLSTGAGRVPDLVVLGRGSTVDVVSHSPAPVRITVSTRYGQPLRPWTTLTAGQSVPTGLTTGHRYGYCYSQLATDGYAAAQACGGLTMHEYINGARAPDGGTVQVTFSFTRAAASS